MKVDTNGSNFKPVKTLRFNELLKKITIGFI